MADPLSLATSILALATVGITLVTTLRIYASAERRINALSSDLAVINNILTDLGNSIQRYEGRFRIKVDYFLEVKEGCERCFGKLSGALKIVSREEAMVEGGDEEYYGKRDGKGRISSVHRRVSPWVRLMYALGGEKEMRELLADVERSKSNLQIVLETFNMFILVKIHDLGEKQMQSYRMQRRNLPSLLQRIVRAEIASFEPLQREFRQLPINEPIFVHRDSSESSSSVGYRRKIITVPAWKSNGPPNAAEPTSVRTRSLSAPVLIENDFNGWNRHVSRKSQSIPQEIPSSDPRDVSGASNNTNSPHSRIPGTEVLIADGPRDPDRGRGLPGSPAPGRRTPGKDSATGETILDGPSDERQFEESQQEERNNIRKGLQLQAPQLPTETEKIRICSTCSCSITPSHSRSPSPSLETASLYEGWLLECRKRPAYEPGHIIFCCSTLPVGFTIEDGGASMWSMHPFSRSTALLKARLKRATTPGVEPEISESRDRIIDKLGHCGRFHVNRLLNDRNSRASRRYSWKLAAISEYGRPMTKKFSLRRKTDVERYLIILRGGPTGTQEPIPWVLVGAEEDLPNRFSNPWEREAMESQAEKARRWRRERQDFDDPEYKMARSSRRERQIFHDRESKMTRSSRREKQELDNTSIEYKRAWKEEMKNHKETRPERFRRKEQKSGLAVEHRVEKKLEEDDYPIVKIDKVARVMCHLSPAITPRTSHEHIHGVPRGLHLAANALAWGAGDQDGVEDETNEVLEQDISDEDAKRLMNEFLRGFSSDDDILDIDNVLEKGKERANESED